MDENEIAHFVERYSGALEAGDLPAVADCHMVPALVLSDDVSRPITALEQVQEAFTGAAEQYRSRGVVNLRGNVLQTISLTPRLSLVQVRWDYLKADGELAMQNRNDYLLRLLPEDELKIQVVIAY